MIHTFKWCVWNGILNQFSWFKMSFNHLVKWQQMVGSYYIFRHTSHHSAVSSSVQLRAPARGIWEAAFNGVPQKRART